MRISTFLYIVLNLVFIQLLALESAWVDNLLLSLGVLGVLTAGISHGAVDNYISEKTSGLALWKFIGRYLLIMLIFVLAWMVFPDFTLIAFLAISAFHFGQAQFTEYTHTNTVIQYILYFSWGAVLLSAMLHFGASYWLGLEWVEHHFGAVLSHVSEHSTLYLYSSGMTFTLAFVLSSYLGKWTAQTILRETYILGLIFVSFILLSPALAFATFFVLIHSLTVLQQEYHHFKSQGIVSTLSSFIKMLMPLTVVSLLGTVLIVSMLYLLGYDHYIPFALVVLLSSVTLPHALVMNSWYTRSSNIKNSEQN